MLKQLFFASNNISQATVAAMHCSIPEHQYQTFSLMESSCRGLDPISKVMLEQMLFVRHEYMKMLSLFLKTKTTRFNEIPKAVILNHIALLLLPEKLNRLFFESHAEIEQVKLLKK